MTTKPTTRPYKKDGTGERRNIYAYSGLMQYIDQQQAAKYNRGFSAEAVELLEMGIKARDGEKALKAVQESRVTK